MASQVLQALKSLYWDLQSSGDSLSERALLRIAEEHDVPVRDVEEGWEFVIESQSDQVDEYYTVFVREVDWVAGDPCVDFRSGTQFLPREVWAIGFLGEGRGIFRMPYLNQEQTEDVFSVLESVLRRAGDVEFAEHSREIVREGTISLDFSKSRI